MWTTDAESSLCACQKVFLLHWFMFLCRKIFTWMPVLPRAIDSQGQFPDRQMMNKWVASSKIMPSNMPKMCRCARTKYYLGLSSSFIYSVVSTDSVSRQWRLWLDGTDRQADLAFTGCISLKTHYLMVWPFWLRKICFETQRKSCMKKYRAS